MSTPFDEQRDAGLMRVSETPLQQPGQDRIIRRSVVAGPDISGDRRWFDRYEVWKLVGCDPRPEPAPPFVTGGR
jgi:hypothetical protein